MNPRLSATGKSVYTALGSQATDNPIDRPAVADVGFAALPSDLRDPNHLPEQRLTP
jgi:hypothetical protein